jgi:hypothetical protein
MTPPCGCLQLTGVPAPTTHAPTLWLHAAPVAACHECCLDCQTHASAQKGHSRQSRGGGTHSPCTRVGACTAKGVCTDKAHNGDATKHRHTTGLRGPGCASGGKTPSRGWLSNLQPRPQLRYARKILLCLCVRVARTPPPHWTVRSSAVTGAQAAQCCRTHQRGRVDQMHTKRVEHVHTYTPHTLRATKEHTGTPSG